MNIVHLTTKEVIFLMSDKEKIIGQGAYGIVVPYDEKNLIKIYYKEIFDGFYYLNEKKLADEIIRNQRIMEDMLKSSRGVDYENLSRRKQKKLEILERIGLVTGKAFCDDYLVGVLLNYYCEYAEVSNIYGELNPSERKIALSRMKQYLDYLISSNIYPQDVKENNILLRKRDLDVKFIDLDDDETRYEQKEYIEKFPHVLRTPLTQFDDMCKRLTRRCS